ncbi:hypothetical protein [Paenibacillus sp. 453mf]|uniref:hypothetical protein n=1 Tax=Paenibacillus sp. 453mf TaxID=1761874 RepID=UPI0008E28482|nr:hypothetical protein [Paenibacillus sp. 453mf]SFS41304.1 hypothetical protein SAMN04488601_101450 [Paenibacillus sp. 453mf]
MSIVLGKEESLVDKKQFTTNLILAWLKTDFTLTSKRIAGHQPNTLFGLIPIGKKEVTFPLKNVSSVGVSTKFHLRRFIFGGVITLIGLSILGGSFFGGLIVTLLGLIPLLNSYTASISYTNNAGHTSSIEMSILEKEKAEQFVQQINLSIADIA